MMLSVTVLSVKVGRGNKMCVGTNNRSRWKMWTWPDSDVSGSWRTKQDHEGKFGFLCQFLDQVAPSDVVY